MWTPSVYIIVMPQVLVGTVAKAHLSVFEMKKAWVC